MFAFQRSSNKCHGEIYVERRIKLSALSLWLRARKMVLCVNPTWWNEDSFWWKSFLLFIYVTCTRIKDIVIHCHCCARKLKSHNFHICNVKILEKLYSCDFISFLYIFLHPFNSIWINFFHIFVSIRILTWWKLFFLLLLELHTIN